MNNDIANYLAQHGVENIIKPIEKYIDKYNIKNAEDYLEIDKKYHNTLGDGIKAKQYIPKDTHFIYKGEYSNNLIPGEIGYKKKNVIRNTNYATKIYNEPKIKKKFAELGVSNHTFFQTLKNLEYNKWPKLLNLLTKISHCDKIIKFEKEHNPNLKVYVYGENDLTTKINDGNVGDLDNILEDCDKNYLKTLQFDEEERGVTVKKRANCNIINNDYIILIKIRKDIKMNQILWTSYNETKFLEKDKNEYMFAFIAEYFSGDIEFNATVEHLRTYVDKINDKENNLFGFVDNEYGETIKNKYNLNNNNSTFIKKVLLYTVL